MCFGSRPSPPPLPPPLPMAPAPKAPPAPQQGGKAEVLGNPDDNIGIKTKTSKADKQPASQSGTASLKIPMNLGTSNINPTGTNLG